MQAVILAAGKSTRTYPLTLTRPKPMLRVLGKEIILYHLDNLKGLVDEVIIVVGYKKEMITEFLGDSYQGMKLTYVEQQELNGTGGAILSCKEGLKDKFLVINGDDLFSRDDIKRCISHDLCIIGKDMEDVSFAGVLEVKEGKIISLEEKPENPKSNIASVGIYLLDKRIFDHELKESVRGEYEITDYISYMIENYEVSCEIAKDYWLPIGYPWNLLEANVFMLRNIVKSDIKGTVEDNVTIKGTVIIEEGTVVKSGSYIEGPVYIGKNCEIGPFAHLRPDSIIEDNCRIGKTEIVDSIIMKNTTAKHFGYLGHTIVGETVNVGAGTVTADWRHDHKTHMTIVNDKKVDSKRRKLGAFIGDNANTGIGTLIYPGRKLWPGVGTWPGEVVKKDKTECEFAKDN